MTDTIVPWGITREIRFEQKPTEITRHCPECGAEVLPCGDKQFQCKRPGCLTRGQLAHTIKRHRY